MAASKARSAGGGGSRAGRSAQASSVAMSNRYNSGQRSPSAGGGNRKAPVAKAAVRKK